MENTELSVQIVKGTWLFLEAKNKTDLKDCLNESTVIAKNFNGCVVLNFGLQRFFIEPSGSFRELLNQPL